MKAADIPDSLILEYLATRQGVWTMLFGTEFSTWWPDSNAEEVTKAQIFPPGTHEKVALAKMRALKKRGLIGGCPCGCRGDFEITDKGLALIGKPRTREYSGY